MLNKIFFVIYVTRTKVSPQHYQLAFQYITPDDHSLLAAADLVLVDEAAAIPLAHVSAAATKAPLALLSSTVSGYEGTGRALSLKLFSQLQSEHNAPPPVSFIFLIVNSKCIFNCVFFYFLVIWTILEIMILSQNYLLCC